MGLMAMQMTGSNAVLSVPSEHLPGLVVLVVLGPALWIAMSGCRSLAAAGVAPAAAFVRRFDTLTFGAKAALFGALVGALVHAAIVPTHWGDERVTAVLFLVDTAGFAFAFWWTFTARRHWQVVDVAMLGGTAAAYALYILKGWESADPVGLITTTVELAAALIVVSPAPRTSSIGVDGRRPGWMAAAAFPLAFVSLVGTAAIAGAVQPPAAASKGSAASTGSATATGVPPAMAGMKPGPSSPTTETLSLATTSPAGPIVRPDAMATMAPGMEMATPNCEAQPTAAEQKAAVTLVDQTVVAAAPYKSLAAAKAAGYVPVTPTGQRIVHYINPAIYRRGQALDPGAIPALVYVNTTHGAVLSAAMYLAPRSTGAQPPQPGGCLTQWHIHDDLCFSGGRVVGNDNAGACAPGSANQTTQPMMHVWLTPVTGGPLAPDPPARSEITAAGAVPALDPPNGGA